MKTIIFLLTFAAAVFTNQQTAAQIKDIVLVHGAFADGSGWKKVYTVLKGRGYKVHIVGNPNTRIEDDVAAIQHVLDRIDSPAVLVGHSYGGALITIAGNSPKVAGLVYVAAFAPEEGESLEKLLSNYSPDPLNGILPPVNGFFWYDTVKYRKGFCADISKRKAAFMAASQILIASVFSHVFQKAAWKTKPSWHIVATKDHTLPTELQHYMARRAEARIVEVRGSHAIYISQPLKVANVIENAVKGSAAKLAYISRYSARSFNTY